MTTFQQPTGSGGSGDDQPGKPPEDTKDTRDAQDTQDTQDAEDTQAIKELVVATSTLTIKEQVDIQPGRGGRVRVARGGLAGQLLGRAGLAPKKVTDQSKRERVAEAQKAEGVRQAAKQSIEEEFWGAVDTLGAFASSPVSSGKHMAGGEDPDPETIAFFADTTPSDWLLSQARGDFALNRTTSERYGDGISFTVYFRPDLKDKRRSVMGYLQQGKLTIIHVGPQQ